MPPEIANKKQYIGFPVDVWSFGIMLYKVVTGIFPFRGKSDSELFKKISVS